MSKKREVTKSNRKRRIIRMRQLREKYPLSQSAIYAKISQGLFPAPFTLSAGGRARGWFEDEIDDFLETLSNDRKGGRDE
jgi:predicted DNA-binding transcriptional regulator AlpA